MLNENNPNWDQLFNIPFEAMKRLKALGFMRLAYILDVMHKCVAPDKIQAKVQTLGRYNGMYPILKTEQRNANYVIKSLQGITFPADQFKLLMFKEGFRPQQKNENRRIGESPARNPQEEFKSRGATAVEEEKVVAAATDEEKNDAKALEEQKKRER